MHWASGPAVAVSGPATSIRRCWKSGGGRLPPEDLRTLTPTQMQRYFLRGTGPHQGLVRVRPELAARVNFQPLNLLAPEWALPGQFDAIFAATS